MMRSNPSSSMQKVYDDCYLICSTAIYFEKQNNEEEALRSWRDALDQIYYHNAYKIPASYKPRTETEKALRESLREMELQCKERVDLLDALRQSRTESQSSESSTNNGRTTHQSGSRRPESFSGDAFAQGTVPTANFSDISRPKLPSRVDQSQPARGSYGRPNERNSLTNPPPPFINAPPSPQPSVLSVPKVSERKSRSPSPKKEPGLLKSTLRPKTRESGRTSSSKMIPTLRNRGSGPSPSSSASAAAASLAWPGAAQLAVQSSANGSSTNLAYSVNGPGKPILEGYDARSSVPQEYSGIYGDQHRQPNLIDDSVPNNLSMYDLPARPRSHEPRQSLPNGHNMTMNSNFGGVANAETGRRTPPLPPPHRTPITPQDGVLQEEQPKPKPSPPDFPSYRKEYLPAAPTDAKRGQSASAQGGTAPEPAPLNIRNSPQRTQDAKSKRPRPPVPRKAVPMSSATKAAHKQQSNQESIANLERMGANEKEPMRTEQVVIEPSGDDTELEKSQSTAWDARVAQLMKNLPRGVDEQAAKAIFNEIVIKGDEVHWDDVAGLEVAKNALKEAVVYPFLRPDLFLGLREPARGMLLFGPPGTGKTMLARAVATESKSTFFAISASSLTSKFLGESEKLVRALFVLAKALAPSIIFVDEIDSLLSSRSGSGEHEATRRIKTEFLIQWSDLAKAAAGREQTDKDKAIGDATRVLVLAATNLPWAIDEAARRRFVRRQYIPLPESRVREDQLRRLMSAQKHALQDRDVAKLVRLTDGFSGSDITALAKDAAMGPLRSLGEQLLHMSPDEIRPISMQDFEASLVTIRPSVSKQGLKEFEDWAKEFGERGG